MPGYSGHEIADICEGGGVPPQGSEDHHDGCCLCLPVFLRLWWCPAPKQTQMRFFDSSSEAAKDTKPAKDAKSVWGLEGLISLAFLVLGPCQKMFGLYSDGHDNTELQTLDFFSVCVFVNFRTMLLSG